MISSIILSKLRNSEFIQFCRDLLKIMATRVVEQQNVTNVNEKLEALLDDMDKIFKTQKGSKITGQLAELDSIRDECIKGISSAAQGFGYHFDETIRNAANAIVGSIAVYGSEINKLNYQAQTTTVINLVHDWESKPVLTDALTTLGFTNWVSKLKEVNEAFNDLFLERVKEESQLSSKGLFETRKEAMDAYGELCGLIEAHHTIGTDPIYNEIIAEFNVLIGKYRQILILRTGSGNDMVEDEEAMEEGLQQ